MSSVPLGKDRIDLLWKQYDMHIDLYKSYLDLLLKFNVFYYAVTGGIVSYYLTKAEVPLMKYALLFPILMSIGFGVFFCYGARLAQYSRDDTLSICEELGLNTAPEYRILQFFLYLSSGLMIAAAIGFGVLFFCHSTAS